MKSNKGKLLLILIALLCLTFWAFIITSTFKWLILQPSIFKVELNREYITDVATRPIPKVTYYSEPYRITVYTPFSDNGKWGYKTATGVKSKHLQTAAVDPNVIPLSSELNINGLKLKAVDTGSAVKGKVIDIFYDGTYYEAKEWLYKFGTSHSVEIIQKGDLI